MTIGFVPSSLTRRRILQGTAALAATSLLPGCGSSAAGNGNSSTSSANPQPVPSGTLTPATITVSATTAGSIGSAFAGLSYEKNTLSSAVPLFTGANTTLIAMFQRLGNSVLRIGGNSVDENVWTPNGPGKTVGQIAPSDVVSLAAFLKATGWKCLYGINLEGTAAASPYKTTPALAAAEVAYVSQTLGTSLLGVEIGNECDVYEDGTNYYAGTGWNLATFETLWSQFRTAILAVTPGVTLTGPADASHESTWTVPFGQYATKSEISLLTQHYYRADGTLPTSTAAFLVTPDPTLIANLQILQSGAQAIGIPYRMSECNSFYNGGSPGISDSYASALWVVDYLFNCAQYGASGVNFHGGGSSTGYTPIANSTSTGAVIEARPEFYGMLLFTLAGQGALLNTTISAGSLNVTAYAVQTPSGGLNLVLNNKDSTNNLQVTLQLPQTVHAATLLEMTQLTAGATAPSLSATEGVTIQGASVNPDGTFSPAAAYTLSPSGTQLTCYLPALSAVLLQLT